MILLSGLQLLKLNLSIVSGLGFVVSIRLLKVIIDCYLVVSQNL